MCGLGAGPERSPCPWRRPLGSGCQAPLPWPRSARSPGRPAALSSCRKFQKLSIIPAQRSQGCQGSPKEGHMPAGRGPPSPHPLPGRAATSGRAGASAAPSRGPAECVAAPTGVYFEREGSGPASVFSAFSWPPARQPGPSAARREGGHVAGGGVEGRRDPARLRPRLRPGPGPGGARRRSGPELAAEARAGLLIARQARAVAPGRPLPARPSRPGHSLRGADAGLTG